MADSRNVAQPTPAPTLRHRLFRALASLDIRHPWLVLGFSALLAIASVLYTRARLEFRTAQDDLVTPNGRDSINYLNYTKEFPDLDGLIVVVKAQPSPSRAELFADALAQRLTADRANVRSVFYRIDPGLMGNRALLYVSLDDLNELESRLRASVPMLRAYGARPTLSTLLRIVNAAIDHQARAHAAPSNTSAALNASMGRGADADSGISTDFLDALFTGMLASADNRAPSPWEGLAPGDNDANKVLHDGFIATEGGKYLLLHVAMGNGLAGGPDAIEAVTADLDAVRAQFPDVVAGMTGGPALAHAEETTTQHDMTLASVIAITACVLLIVIPFRGLIEPLFTIIALLTGVAWSFGFTTLVVGHLNLLSAVFASVLAGIGINFPIHLMARYDEARRSGLGMPAALELAVVNTGIGVFASACIMALAFLMPMFTDFKGIAELGLVSAGGLFMCLLSAMLVFPALIAIRDRGRAPGRPPRSLVLDRSMLERLFARPKMILCGTAIISLGALFLARGVRFDQNLLKLQASEVEAVRYENILLRDSGRSSWFAVALAPTQQRAEAKAAAFSRLDQVSDVETIETYIPHEQAAKRAILTRIAATLDPLSIRGPAPPDNPVALTEELTALTSKLDQYRDLDPSGRAVIVATLADQTLARLKHDGPGVFAAYGDRIARDLARRIGSLRKQLAPGVVTAANLPPVLRQRFIGASGLYLVQIYPKGDIWEDAPLERFIAAIRTVDPDVTGPPVQTFSAARVMRYGYERAGLLGLLAVFIFVFADFRSLRDTVLATVPLFFGGVWLLETMGALGWEFNLANLFAVPIIIGMGVDNGVNMLYRWREEQDKSSLILTRSVGKSVTICSLTTIAAFAALIPASHHGISSLGWVLSLGVGFILLATLVVLPALFELLGSRISHHADSSVHDAKAVSTGNGNTGSSNGIAADHDSDSIRAIEKPPPLATGGLR